MIFHDHLRAMAFSGHISLAAKASDSPVGIHLREIDVHGKSETGQ